MQRTENTAIDVKGLTRRFDSDSGFVVANDSIDLSVQPGALHAIIGENGAGKSTLAHILAGIVRPDTGTIRVFDTPIDTGSPAASRSVGIGLVAQHFTLVDTLTVWENVVLGNEPMRDGRIDPAAARETVHTLSSMLGVEISPDALISALPLPTRQSVEIIKVLARDASILILDEPTSVLGPEESKRLFAHVESLRRAGTTVLLITHRIREVVNYATSVTVLRHGKSVATFARDEFDSDRIIETVIGGAALPTVNAHAPRPVSAHLPSVVLSINGLTTDGAGTEAKLNGLSLQVSGGEIVGLAGVAGNGQTELADTIAGLRNASSGVIVIDGQEVTSKDARTRRQAGLAYIPEDRKQDGLVGTFSVRDNLFLGGHGQFGSALRWDREAADTAAETLIRKYDIRTLASSTPVDRLSGGNQQKVILARELSRNPKLIIALHPTQGLDIGAAAFVHDQLRAARASGSGILVVSSDLEELRSLTDRIAVIFSGRIVGIADTDAYDEQVIGKWMTSGNS